MNKYNLPLKLAALFMGLSLTACGGSDNGKKSDNEQKTQTTQTATETATATETDSAITDETQAIVDPANKIDEAEKPIVEQGIVQGSFSTGSIQEPVFVYYDLDQAHALTLSEEEAASNKEWDIAFKRASIYLNSQGEVPVSAYFMGNNADFYDAEGKAVADKFINASAESELDAYLAVSQADIPAGDDVFKTDAIESIMAGFYNYNFETHQVSAADDKYYIVQSDEAYTKVNVTNITTAGRAIGEITFAVAHQSIESTEFAIAQELVVDAVANCSDGSSGIYIDFDLNQVVSETDAWDLMLTCKDTGADFELSIAQDAKAAQDFINRFSGVKPEEVRFINFESNKYTVKAFDDAPWYAYGVNGSHLLWSQYGIYLIKTAAGVHKLQVTSYYNEEGTSGNYSFRSDKL